MAFEFVIDKKFFAENKKAVTRPPFYPEILK